MENYFRIGKVSTSHGVRGAMKVIATTSDPKRYSLLKTVLYSASPEELIDPVEWHVTKVQYQADRVLLSVEEITDCDQAFQRAGGSLWIDRKDALPLGEGEFYTADLIGALVKDDEGNPVGRVKEFYTLINRQEVMVVQGQTEEFEFPVIPECLLSFSVEEQSITVHHRFYKDFA